MPNSESGSPYIITPRKKTKNRLLPYIIILILLLLLGGLLYALRFPQFLFPRAQTEITTINIPTPAPVPTVPPVQVPAGTAFTPGSVIFAGKDGDPAQDNKNFFWDDTNFFLGIGTNLPSAYITVSGVPGGAGLALLQSQGNQFILQGTNNGLTVFNVGATGSVAIAGSLSDINDSTLNIAQNLATGGDISVGGGDITSSNQLRIYGSASTVLGLSTSPVTITGNSITFKDANLTNSITLTKTATALPNGNTGIVDAIVDAYNHAGSSSQNTSFSALTSGTNTQAAMVVGSGASLTFTGTGTITASGLSCSGCVSNSALANSTITFAGNSGSTAISLGGTENIVGAGTVTTSQSGSTLTITGSSGTNFWQLNGTDLSPTSATYNLAIGGTNSSSPFYVVAATGDIKTAGDIAVNGGDVTSTATTFNLLNSTVTTLNIGGAATTVSLGAGTGTTTVNNSLTVSGNANLNGNTTLGNAGTDTITFTGAVNSNVVPSATNSFNLGSSSALEWNNVYAKLFVQNGFNVCDSSGANCPATTNFWQLNGTDLSPTSATYNLAVGGTDSTSPFYVTASSGNIKTNGDIAVNGGDLTSTSTTFNLVNSGVTTVNLGGGASTVSIGALSGTTTINNALSVTGNTFLNGNTTLGNASSDTISFTGSVNTDVLPLTTDLYNLGSSSSLEWNNVYAKSFFQNGNSVCDSSGAGCPPGSTNFWNQTSGALYPANSSVDLLVGSSSTGSAKFAFINVASGTPTASIAGSITSVATYLTGNGTLSTTNSQPLTLGSSTTGSVTINSAGSTALTATGANLLAGGNLTVTGNILPVTTDTSNIGASSLSEFNNVYAKEFFQSGNAVCDSSGANCPAGTSLWTQSQGTIYPTNTTVDLLVGGNSTASAKFAFINVDAGIPTASIAGNLSGVSTYLTGNGTLSTTNMQNLILGSSTTGNVIIDSAGSTALTATGANLTTGNDLTVSGNESVNGGNITTNQTTFNLINTTATTLNIGGGATTAINLGPTGANGTINLSGGSADTGCTLDGTTGNFTCSGNIQTTASSGTQGWWQLISTDLSPTSTTYNLAVGGTNSASPFYVTAASGNIKTAGDIAVNGGDITTTSTVFNITFANTGTLSFTDGTNNLVQISDLGTTGDLAVSGALQVAGLTTAAYSRIGTALTTHAGVITTASDLLVSGSLEIDGNIFIDNNQISNSNGTALILFAADPATNLNTLSDAWLVDNSGNPGKAAFIVNQSSTVNDIFDASSSGSIKFRIANNGDTTVGPTGLGKITVGTVDPPYTINGGQYATYLPGITGVKEETAGTVTTDEYIPGKGYRSVIDFNSPEVGSDIWLFSKATDIKNNLKSLVALLTPSNDTSSWYEVDSVNGKLAIYSSRPATVSYRLTAPRFDATQHPNTRTGGVPGFTINIPDVINTTEIATTVQKLSDFIIENVSQGVYVLKDSGGTIIDGLQSVGNLVAANIRAGHIEAEMISPVPSKDLDIQLPQDSKFNIKDPSDKIVASIDNAGNATFSGTVKSTNIDSIQKLLSQVQVDQNTLSQIISSEVSSTSANLSNLITNDLYVTGQAAISSLSVTQSVSFGTNFLINIKNSSIDSLNTPLNIQSQGLAPVNIMAGLIKISTKGDVEISGNLNVHGQIAAASIKVGGQDKFNNVIEVSDKSGAVLASVDSSGSALFNTVKTGQIYGTDEERGSVDILPAEDSKNVARNWTASPSAILVSASYKTQAWVTDLNTGGFNIKVSDSPTDSPQKLFWWAVW